MKLSLLLLIFLLNCNIMEMSRRLWFPWWRPTVRPTKTTTRTTTTFRPCPANNSTNDIPWFPGVIIPHPDDQPPKFTATISTPSKEPRCSGTIISLHFVLSTCKRCLQEGKRPIPSANLVVLVGDLQPDATAGLGIVGYDVERVMLHVDCFHDGIYNIKHDIGMVKTFKEIKYGDFVEPAKIPLQTHAPNHNKNWMLATFIPGNTLAVTLKEAVWFVKVRTVRAKICRKILNSTYYDKTRNYCTPYEHARGKNGCVDDFGASVSLDDTLIGLLIHKFGCGNSETVASFANVAFNSQWIRDTVKKLSNGKELV